MSNLPTPSSFSRRRLLQYGGGLVGTSLMATVLGGNPRSPLVAHAQGSPLTPEEALAKLMAGNDRFVTEKRTNRHQNRERLLEVAKGQNPFAAVLGCADSRVPVEIVFDQGLGDIFVCRVAGNIATPEEIGSLEFGTLVLGAKVLVVMGHGGCGAVKAAIVGGEFPGQIGSLIQSIETGPITGSKTDPTQLDQAIKTNVLAQVARLKQSPVIGELVAKNQLKVVGSFYDLDTGKVSWL